MFRARIAVMTEAGKIVMAIGAGVVLVGAWMAFGKGFLPGQLPGDLVFRGKNTVVYLPLGTCVVVSLVLTLLRWLFGRH